jgi:hypothetical protein
MLFVGSSSIASLQWRHAAKEEEEKESEYAALGQNQNAFIGAAPISRRAGNSAFVNHQVGGERDLKSPFISYR